MSDTQRNAPFEELRTQLDSLCQESARYIRATRRRTAIARSLQRSMPWLVLVPALWLVLLAALSFGDGHGPAAIWVLPATLAVPVAFVLFAVLSSAMASVDRRDALATIDQQLGLEDRLVTAEQFLQEAQPSPFVAAALEDAARIAPGARHAIMNLPSEPLTLGPRDVRWIAASVVLMLLSSLIGGGPSTTRNSAPESGVNETRIAAIEGREDTSSTRPEPQARADREQPKPTTTPPTKSQAAQTRRDKPGELSDDAKQS